LQVSKISSCDIWCHWPDLETKQDRKKGQTSGQPEPDIQYISSQKW